MSVVIAEPPLKTWSRAEIDALEAAGLLAGTRLELIDGEVFDKMGQNPPHASAICRLVRMLAAIFGLERIRTQLPIEPAEGDSPRSLPLPDVVVTREIDAAYQTRHPGPSDILLIAEVADSSIEFDMKRKARLYARAGFIEYPILDLNDQELLVYQSPRGGVYTEIHVLRPGDLFHPSASPQSSIAVADLLPA